MTMTRKCFGSKTR